MPLTSVPIPRSFLCPITQDVMQDPVATVDGHTYERGAIEAWFRRGHRTSPLTNASLPSLALTPERALRKAIAEYLVMRPELARPEVERRSYREAAEVLQGDLLQMQAATKGKLFHVKAKLMEKAATLLSLRGTKEVRDVATRIGMELHSMAATLEDGPPPLAHRHSPGADRGAALAAAASSSASPSASLPSRHGPRADRPAGLAAVASPSSSQPRWPSRQAGAVPTRCAMTIPAGSSTLSLVDAGAGKLVCGCDDGSLKVWDWAAQRCEANLGGHATTIRALALLSDGRLASASDDGTMKVWDLPARRCQAELHGHASIVMSLAQLPGSRLASASYDSTIKIWSWQARHCEATLDGHDDWVWAVAGLPEGILASASQDQSVRLWDWAVQRCVATLHGHEAGVGALAPLARGGARQRLRGQECQGVGPESPKLPRYAPGPQCPDYGLSRPRRR